MNREPIEQIAKKIADGELLTDDEKTVASRIIMAVGQQFYEKTGAMFISGYAGEIEADGCPEFLFVAPAFGVDFSTTYQKFRKP